MISVQLVPDCAGVSNQFLYNEGIAYGFNNNNVFSISSSLTAGFTQRVYWDNCRTKRKKFNLFGTWNGVIYGLKNTFDHTGMQFI
ncbi:MAG: hypothetical protein U0T80_06965 [Flavobacteriaceae bacterium]